MIKTVKQNPSGTIALDYPTTRNALSREMVAALIEAFSDFHREKSVRAVILTAKGAVFCSGVDLKEWHPKPIIASIDGSVHGMGLALALASDLVVASPSSTFELSASKLGLISGLVAPLLAFRCGGGVAAKLLLGGDSMDAVEAYRLGVVHHIVASELTWAKAHEISGKIAQCAPESIQMTKRLLNEMIGESLLTHLVSGAAAMATACTTSAAIEGLAAFSEKREPKFP